MGCFQVLNCNIVHLLKIIKKLFKKHYIIILFKIFVLMIKTVYFIILIQCLNLERKK